LTDMAEGPARTRSVLAAAADAAAADVTVDVATDPNANVEPQQATKGHKKGSAKYVHFK
jgi:hypothetical protein